MRARFTALTLVLLAILAGPRAAVAQGTIVPWVEMQFLTTAGAVCSGCLLNVYAPGTTTRRDTFSNITLATPNANPVVMDSAGRPTSGYI